MSHLTMPHQSITSALVITVSAQSFDIALALAHAVANDLAAAELHFLAVDREVASRPRSTSSVSARRTRSPVVGPNISTYGAAADLHPLRAAIDRLGG